jgi:hypothetical protein
MTDRLVRGRSRDDVVRAAEAASHAEAEAQRAHHHAMVLSLRAALAHERVAVAAACVGMPAQVQLHEGLAVRARTAAQSEAFLVGGDRTPRAEKTA